MDWASIIETVMPALLGGVAIVLTWLIRRFAWDVDKVKAIWLTYVVSVGIAIATTFLSGGIPQVITCPLNPLDPPAFAACVLEVAENILAASGIVFGAATIIYQALRREIAGRSILGDRL